jgi:pimeloyl-ACP methyl ester carboxylesterase
MTTVFVHGNPETDAIWGPLLAVLGRDDTVCLSPPGFGAPLPGGFGATMIEYRDWLIGELAELGEPVHLIGHDWGGVHVINVAMARPDLLRSWVSDVAGLFEPDYEWHVFARTWQTPIEGEKEVAALMNAPFEERVSVGMQLGMPRPVAEANAAAQGDDMGTAILALYRSAAQPILAEHGRDLPKAAARPGLSLLPTDDYFVGSNKLRRRAAARAGARLEVLDGLGHWWMLQDPAKSAEVITRFLHDVG